MTLVRSPRFVADPWQADALAAVPAHGAVVFVGAGLTMADTALRCGRAGVRLHVVSRHGLLPLAHLSPAPARVPPPARPGQPTLSLAQARRHVFAHLRAVRSAGGDWRAAIDSLRGSTAELWGRLDPEARAGFRSASRRWDRARHRVEPTVGTWLDERRADGTLQTHAGSIVDATERDGHVEVRLSTGQTIAAAAVINCTGPDDDVRSSDNPLVMNLLNSTLARPGHMDMGFACDATGRLESGRGDAPAVWALGSLRRGQLWETTAIPEIRVQAAAVARAVLAALPAPQISRRPRDPYGLPLSARPAAAEAYVGALGRILRVQAGAENLVAEAVAADPDFALGHAVLALLGVEWSADVDVPTALALAQRLAGRADERERRFIDVVTERVNHPGAQSAATLLSYVQAYPEDALAASIAVPTIAFAGATEVPAEAWALVEGLAPAYGEDWWYRGLLAFIRQEQGDYDEAARLADLALAVEPAAGQAAHARTHVYYETGQHAAGLAWLDEWIRRYSREASHRAHFSWHAALHELALGQDQAAARRYADQLSPPSVSGVRALIDSASLLWRGYTVGAWPAAQLDDILAGLPRQLLIDPPTPFVALHAAVALTAAGDCQGLAQLRRTAVDRDDPVFADTVAPLADALTDLVHGDADRATDALRALTGVERLGGSAAQREIVEDTLLFTAVRAGRLDLADAIMSERLDRRASPRDSARRAALRRPPALPHTGR